VLLFAARVVVLIVVLVLVPVLVVDDMFATQAVAFPVYEFVQLMHDVVLVFHAVAAVVVVSVLVLHGTVQ